MSGIPVVILGVFAVSFLAANTVNAKKDLRSRQNYQLASGPMVCLVHSETLAQIRHIKLPPEWTGQEVQRLWLFHSPLQHWPPSRQGFIQPTQWGMAGRLVEQIHIA